MGKWEEASGKATSPQHFKQLLEAGKGDDPRPRSVSDEEFSRRWEQTFGSTDNEEDTDASD